MLILIKIYILLLVVLIYLEKALTQKMFQIYLINFEILFAFIYILI